MSNEKRTFASDTLSMSSINLNSISEVDEDGARTVRSSVAKRELPFSKELVLRLIEWLEQK